MPDAGPTLPWTVRTKSDLAAARVLLREVGPVATARLAVALRLAEARGEPFADLPVPDSIEERLSRTQLGPAVVLYRRLCDSHGADEALRITEAVVIAGAVSFLGSTVGPLRRSTLAALDADGRASFTQGIARRFFNATVRWDHVDADEVRFSVTACRFARLCLDLGEPHLAPIFCKGDAHFFGRVEPGVLLDRGDTIATGATECAFRLYWADPPAA